MPALHAGIGCDGPTAGSDGFVQRGVFDEAQLGS